MNSKPAYGMTSTWRIRSKTETESLGAERIRRWIVFLVFVIYWLLIFEGALRKWIFPDAFHILFFVRDPFVLLVYGLAILKPRPLPGGRLLAGWLVLGLIALQVGAEQLWAGDTELVVLGYGWRNYFYYIPLAFIIGANFRQSDLERLIRHTLFVAIPIAVLVFLQFLSPSGALINAGAVEGGLYQPGVVGDIVRTYGTFTSSSGQTLFVASLVALLLSNWMLSDHQRPIKGVWLLLASLAVVTNLAVSGSRAAFVQTALILLCALFSALLLLPGAKCFKNLLLLLIISIVATVIILVIFPDAAAALWERWEGAYYSESALYGPLGIIGRAFFDFGHFTNALPVAPPLGYGVGWLGNAFASQTVVVLDAEDDWSRNIFELGPVMGLLFIGFRIAFVTWLMKNAMVAVRRTESPLPLLLVGFVGIVVLSGQVSGHGSVNGFGWLFAGFCIAANQLSEKSLKNQIARD